MIEAETDVLIETAEVETEETVETAGVEAAEQETASKKPEANRASVEELLKTDGIDRVISQLKRFRVNEIKEMIRDEYPKMDQNSDSVMDMTKKELLDWLKDFYTE